MYTPNPEYKESVIDRLWVWLTALYGSQKVASMWTGLVDPDDPQADAKRTAVIAEFKSIWGKALARFHVQVIGAAVQELAGNGSGWPPTLPEFVKICRDCEDKMKAQRHAVALPDDTAVADPESPKVKAAMEEMRNLLKLMPS